MIKVLAFTTMLLDHIGHTFFPNETFLSIIGRLAFPLFAWSIAFGYKRTKSVNSYILRVLLLAVVSEIPHLLLFDTNYLNVCFTLVSGIIVIKIIESKLKVAKWPLIILVLILSSLLGFEYGIYGIITILIFYYIKNKYLIVVLQALATIVFTDIYHYSWIQIFSLFSLPLIFYFQNSNLRLKRIINYSFYPLHMVMLLIIKYILSLR